MSDDTPTERFDPNVPDPKTPASSAGGTPTSSAGGTPTDDSGDAPTRRFDQAGSDAPTERFATPSGRSETQPLPPPRVPQVPRPVLAQPTATKSRGPMIAFIVIVAVLLLALTLLLFNLATRGPETVPAPVASPETSEAPTPTPTPTEPEPEASPEPTPSEEPVADPGAAFTTFSPESGTPVSCPDETSSIPLTFEWTSTGATAAWIGVGTNDAKAEPYAEVDTSGVFTDISYQCSNPSEIYTVTLDDGAGTLTHATVTLERALG